MTKFMEFAMERMMSVWENRVEINLSESGVHPMTLAELLAMKGMDVREFAKIEINYPQANGLEELRETIAAMYPGATSEHVLVTVGAAEANYLAIHTLLEPGDQMVVVLPNYMQVYGIAVNRGVQIQQVHLLEDQGWSLDAAALEVAVSPATKLIAVCNPNNPTGRIFTSPEMDLIVQAASKVGAWLLADEVYRGAERETDTETPTFFGRYDRVLAQGSMSKAYGLPGLRLGWTVGPKDLCTNLWKRHEYTTIATTMLSNHLANMALSPEVRPQILQRTRQYIRAGYDQLSAWAHHNREQVRVFPPQAAAIAFLRYSAEINSTRFVEQLRDERSVLIVPGDHFGLDGCLRVSYGLPSSYLADGLRRIQEALEEAGK